MKRPPPYWQLPGTVNMFPDGTKVREESVGADTVLLHITYPADVDTDKISNFAERFGREMPRNVRAVFTDNTIGIHVNRPRSVSLVMSGNTIQSKDLLERIEQIMSDNSVTTVHMSITDNTIVSEPKKEVRKTAKKKVTKKATTKRKSTKGNGTNGTSRPERSGSAKANDAATGTTRRRRQRESPGHI